MYFRFDIQKRYVLLKASRFLTQHRAIKILFQCAAAVGCCSRHHTHNRESMPLTCPAPYGHKLVKFVRLLLDYLGLGLELGCARVIARRPLSVDPAVRPLQNS